MRRRSPAIVTTMLATIALALVAAACGPAPSGVSAGTTELTVYAAASLRGALEEIARAYTTSTPGIRLTVSTAASSALRAQIEQGAPADVFLSADTAQPAALVAGGLAAGDALTFAANWPTIIVPTADPAGIETPADLARPGVRIVAAGDAVPITRYATELLAGLAALDGYPAGFADAVAANVVSREEDVKVVVARIELGEGDAAIVYRTDALVADAVSVIEIPLEANVAASYAGVVLKASTHPGEARAFLGWLTGERAQVILESHGFSSPPPAR